MIGLAPIRPDLKGRLRELLCIHGRKWSPRLVSRQRLLVFSEALICLSYPGKVACQAVAGEQRLVVPRGNAPLVFRLSGGRSALELQDGKVNREASIWTPLVGLFSPGTPR